MAQADPARFFDPARFGGNELALRIGASIVLAPLAVAVAYLGGWPFIAFWGAAALIILWEWSSLVAGRDRRAVLMTGGASVMLAVMLTAAAGSAASGVHPTRLLAAITVLAMGMLGVAALTAREQRRWAAGGVPYAGALGIAPVLLRSDDELGFTVVIFLFAVVWSTDIFAFFIGRAAGGPKLAPRFSPKKTWSGAIGGTAAAVVAALIIAKMSGSLGLLTSALIAALLSVAAQAGDLFESALKRQFGAKDSSHLIPGHGGLMDRLDSFVAAAVLAALIGLLRGGLEAPARGLLLW